MRPQAGDDYGVPLWAYTHMYMSCISCSSHMEISTHLCNEGVKQQTSCVNVQDLKESMALITKSF